jgi:hypothetical protein
MANTEIAGSARGLANEQLSYRDAMARFGASVNVVRTNGPAGQAGFRLPLSAA